ncbi:MAG: S41 family peptidase [Cytophagales bacterium]|nr:S41 family peptidase [Cytophagales bacterium]
MKKVLLFLLLSLTLQGTAQVLSTKDSISIFYDSLIYQLQTRYLYRGDVDWETIDPLKKSALEAENFGKSLAMCTTLFDTINGSHLNIFSDHGWFRWSKGKQYTQEQFHTEFLLKYEEQPGFEVKVIDGKYGYILMPSMLMLDISQDSINLETQQMYNQIMKTVNSHKIEGWVIDLRFNGGGNVFPMLAALYHFLGDDTLYTSLGINHTIRSIVTLRGGIIHDTEDGIDRARIIPIAQPDLKTPVALITGIVTGSSGELIPVSFRGRQNITVIGEATAGLLTGNSLTELPFDVKLTLTTSFLTDRKASHEPLITPDVIIEKQANFKDLSKDPNIIEAIKFFETIIEIEKESNKQ